MIQFARTMVYASLTMLATCGAVANGNDDALQWDIRLPVDGDTAEVTSNGKRVVVAIHSSRGIGRATIERRDESWPAQIVIQLHVSGLENWRVSNGTDTLHASVSSHPATPRIRSWKNDQEDVLLNKQSRYWMPIKRRDSQGKQTKEIPSKQGYFEIQLPKALFEGNPPEVSLHWIDFYRG